MDTMDVNSPEPLDSEQLVRQSRTLAEASLRYRDIVLEYCLLALKPTLTEPEQDRMGDILALAAQDALLSFWIGEADHLVAHHLDLIDDAFIQQQQDRFRQIIRQSRPDQGHPDERWHALKPRNQRLQKFLGQQGCVRRSIDGADGPDTTASRPRFQQQSPQWPRLGYL